MASVDQIINGIIDKEGGYIDHADDAGGPTNFGITLKLYRVYHPTATIDNLKVMAHQEAYSIYESEFYIKTGIKLIFPLSQRITEEVLDTAVNLGPSWGISFLQRSLNAFNLKGKAYSDIPSSGTGVGPLTVAALKAFLAYRGQLAEPVMLKALNSLQAARYIELAEKNESDESFVFGWINQRVSL